MGQVNNLQKFIYFIEDQKYGKSMSIKWFLKEESNASFSRYT